MDNRSYRGYNNIGHRSFFFHRSIEMGNIFSCFSINLLRMFYLLTQGTLSGSLLYSHYLGSSQIALAQNITAAV